MVTEHKHEIKKLELELASMTQPCPCGLDSYCVSCLPENNYMPEGAIPIQLEGKHSTDCHTCKGTGVVPLIEGSRRKCEENNHSKKKGSLLATHYDALPAVKCPGCIQDETQQKCTNCEGRTWIPALDGTKMLTWMLSFGFSYIRLATDKLYPGTIKSLFVFNGEDVWIEAKDPQETLLRACLAGIEAMNAKAEA